VSCKNGQSTVQISGSSVIRSRQFARCLYTFSFSDTLKLSSIYVQFYFHDIGINFPFLLFSTGKSEGLQVLCSLKRNWAQFFLIKKEDIGCIHGLRTVATFMLFFAHNTIPLNNIPFINRTELTEVRMHLLR
jgi:hypothetical protein